MAGWQQEGKKCFQAKLYRDAAAAYDKALQLMQQQQQHTQGQQAATASSSSCGSSSSYDGALLLQLLLNASAAHHKLQQRQPCLAYAAAAVVLSNHESSKAHFRLAFAVDAAAVAAAATGDGQAGQAGASAGASSALAKAATALMVKSADLTATIQSAADRQDLLSQLVTYDSSSSSSNSSRDSSGQDSTLAWEAVCSIIGPAVTCLLRQMVGSTSAATAGSTASDRSNSSTNSFGPAAAVPVSHSQSAAEVKESGNAAFRTADYCTALHYYQAALAHTTVPDTAEQAAVLLSNRSACYLQLGGQSMLQHACVDGAAAVLLDRSNIKGWYRLVNALLQLKLTQSAADVCSLGLHVHADEPSLQQLQTRIRLATSSGQLGSTSNSGSTSGSSSSSARHSVPDATSTASNIRSSSSSGINKGGTSAPNLKNRSGSSRHEDKSHYLSERELAELRAKDVSSVEQMSMINNMANLAERFGKKMPGAPELVDNRVPPFHEEFAMAGRYSTRMTSLPQRTLND